jgi:hypothetical protein
VWLNAGNTGTVGDFMSSLKGAKGDKGADGAAGSQGPKGDTGSAANAVTITSQVAGNANTSVSCPTATPNAVGGGASMNSASKTVNQSFPSQAANGKANGWKAVGGGNPTDQMTIYVICAA